MAAKLAVLHESAMRYLANGFVRKRTRDLLGFDVSAELEQAFDESRFERGYRLHHETALKTHVSTRLHNTTTFLPVPHLSRFP